MDEEIEQQMTDKRQCSNGSTSVDEGCQQLTAPIWITRVPGSGCGLLSVRNTHTILALPSENQQANSSRLLTHFQSRRGYVPRPYHHTVDVLSDTAGRTPQCKVTSFDAPGCRAALDSAARRAGPVAKGRATVSRQAVSPYLVPSQLGLPPEEVGGQEEENEEEKLYQPARGEIRPGVRPRVDPPDDADYATASSYDSTADRAGDHGAVLAYAAVQPYVTHVHNAGALRASGKVEPDQPLPLPATGAAPASPAEAITPSDDCNKASKRSHVAPSQRQAGYECQQCNGEEEAPLPVSMLLQTQQSQLETLQQRINEEQEQEQLQRLQQQEGSFGGQQNGTDDPSHPLGLRWPGSPLAGVNSRPKRQRREPAALSSYVSSALGIRRKLSTKKQKASVSVGNLELANGSELSLGDQCMMPAPAPAPLPLAKGHAGHHWAPGPSGVAGDNGGPVPRSDHRGGSAGRLLCERGPIQAPPSGWTPPRRKLHGGSSSSCQDTELPVRSCRRQQRFRRMCDLVLLPEVKLPALRHGRSSGDDESEGVENEDVCTDQADAAAVTGVSRREATTANGASATAEVQGRVTGASAAGSASPAERPTRDASGVARELAAARTAWQRTHTAVVLKGTNQVKLSIPSARVLFPDILPKVCSRAGKAVELYLAVPRSPTRAPRTQTQALHMRTSDDASADAGVGALRLERLAGVSLYGGGVAWALTGLRGMMSTLGLSHGQKARLTTVPDSRHQQDSDDGVASGRDLPGVIVSRMEDGPDITGDKEKPLWANNYNGLLTVPTTVTERLFPEVVASGREATLPIQAFASLPGNSELRAFRGVCLRGLFRRVVLAGLKTALMQLGVQEGEEVALWRHADGRMVLSKRKDAPPLRPPGPMVAAAPAAENGRAGFHRGKAGPVASQPGCGHYRPKRRDWGRAWGRECEDDSDEGKGRLDDASQAVEAEERPLANTARQSHTRRGLTPEFGDSEAAISIADPDSQTYEESWQDGGASSSGSDEEDYGAGSEPDEEPQVQHQPQYQPGLQPLGGPLQRRPHGAVWAAEPAAPAWGTSIGGSRSSSVPKSVVNLMAPRPSWPAPAALDQPAATATDFNPTATRFQQAEEAVLKPLRGLGLAADNDHTQERDGWTHDIPLEGLVYLDDRSRGRTGKCDSMDGHRRRGAELGLAPDRGCRSAALELDLSTGATFVDAYNRGHRNHQHRDYFDGYKEGGDEDMDIGDSIPSKRSQRRSYMSGAPRVAARSCATVNGMSSFDEGFAGETVPCYISSALPPRVPSLSKELPFFGEAPLVMVNSIAASTAAAIAAAHSGLAPLPAVHVVRLSSGRPKQGDDARPDNNIQHDAALQLPVLPSPQKRRRVSPHVLPREGMAGAEISLGAAEWQLQARGAYNKNGLNPPWRTSATVQSARAVTGSARASTRDIDGEMQHQLPAKVAAMCTANTLPADSGMAMGFRAPLACGGSDTAPYPSQQPRPWWVAVPVPVVEVPQGISAGGNLAGRVRREQLLLPGPPPQVQIRAGASVSPSLYAAAEYGDCDEGNLAETARNKTPLVRLRHPSAAAPWLAPDAAAEATTLGRLASENELVTIRRTRAGACHASACALEESVGALALGPLLFPADGGSLWWG